MKKVQVLLIAFLVSFASTAFAAGDGDMHVFVRDGCTHCADLKEFVDKWEDAPEVTYHNVIHKEAQDLFEKLQLRLPGLQQAVPVTVIDGQIIQGFDTDETTGERLKNIINNCTPSDSGCVSFNKFLLGEGTSEIVGGGETCIDDPTVPCTVEGNDDRFVFDFWFVGETDLREFSLPVLSLILGGLDGFNPCAMWVLITLLTLLINTRSWKKIWVIGGIFLFVSGAMYYVFIAAWLNVFLLVGLNVWVQKLIGIVAIGGGSFYLYEAFGKDPNECKVTNLSSRKKTIDKMRRVIEIASWPSMILGVAILAFSVNLIELVCTAGLPAIFTEILAFNDLSNLSRYWYMLLYIIAYMIDDLIIFAIAISTLRATGLTTRYRRFSLIFGGVLMATLGILMIFWPEVLVF